MQHFRNNNFFLAVLFLCILSNYNIASACTTPNKKANLSGVFAKTLSKNGGFEIKNNPEYCTSHIRPLTINQELLEIIAYAMQSSEYIKFKTECIKAEGVDKYKFCRFYAHSINKTEQWSLGFTFLGNINSGEIKLDSLECFGTP